MKTVYVGGVFDLLHHGHIRLLERAAKLGDKLVVGVLTDAAASRYKPRPIMHQEERMRLIRALRCVTEAIYQNDTNASEEIEGCAADILVHGSDHTPDWNIGQHRIGYRGGVFVLLPYTTGISSTKIKRRILDRSRRRSRPTT